MDGVPYLIAALIRYGIYFKVSTQVAGEWEWAELEWPSYDVRYKDEMKKRLLEAIEETA